MKLFLHASENKKSGNGSETKRKHVRITKKKIITGNISVMSSPSGFNISRTLNAHFDLISGSIAQKNLQIYHYIVIIKQRFSQTVEAYHQVDLRIVKNEIKQLRWAPSEEVCLQECKEI